MVKKHFALLNQSVMKSELGFRSKLRFWAQDENEIDAKNRNITNSTSELTNPLEMVKTFQAFESINSDVRARI